MTEDFPVMASLVYRRGLAEGTTIGPVAKPDRFSPADRQSLQALPTAVTFAKAGRQGLRGRLQEKVLTRGTDALADQELLEMLLFPVLKPGDTKRVAQVVTNRFGSFARVLLASERELLETPGLGPPAVAAIKVVQASAVRLARAEVMEGPVLNNWGSLINYLNAVMALQPIEQLRVLFLDNRNHLLTDEVLARGTVGHTPVYPREVMKRALELYATALILVHNHPSGDPTPSDEDIDMTRNVKWAASALSIELHDHIIVGSGGWFSFRQNGLLARE